MKKNVFLILAMFAVVFSTVEAKASKKRSRAETDTYEKTFEVGKIESNYVVIDIEDVKRVEISCDVPGREAQMKFDVLDDVAEFDNFKDASSDGNYKHIIGCEYLGKNYHKILDKKTLKDYQLEGQDELYLVFKNRNILKNSKVNVTITYTYYKDGEAPVQEEDEE